MQDIQDLFKTEETVNNHKADILSQSFLVDEKKSSKAPQTAAGHRMDELIATQLLSIQLREDLPKSELIDHLTSAYHWHKSQADRFKSLLEEVTASITADIDRPVYFHSKEMKDEMKKVLEKKKKNM